MIKLAVLIVGLSGVIAQVLLLRELLVNFYGNELTIGIILANWVALEAAGAYIIGKEIDRTKNRARLFVVLELLFCVILALCIYFCRTFKYSFGIPQGEAPGLIMILVSSFLILFPLGFCHGALFSACCAVYPVRNAKAVSIGRVYSWETIGTILGALILTYLFIPYLDAFRIALIVALLNLLICFVFFKGISGLLRFIVICATFLAAGLFFGGGADYLQRSSVNRQWPNSAVLAYRNSIYGNIAVTKKLEQYTFFYNGLPLITAPYPDIALAEEFGHFSLLSCDTSPRDVLVLGAGAGGLIYEILKHPVAKVDYAELDPLLIRMLRDFPTPISSSEFKDQRLKVINQDARFFVRNSRDKYDVILIGASSPADLTTNRLFTEKFFAMAKERLNPAGILSFRLEGSLTYLSREMRDLNGCIANSLKNVFGFVRVIPGDYNLYLASDAPSVTGISPALFSARLRRQNIKTRLLVPAYLEHRLDKKRLDWFNVSMAAATKETNRDLRPQAVLRVLLFWNQRLSPGLSRVFSALAGVNLIKISILVLLLTFGLIFGLLKQPKSNFPVTYGIFTTGFFGMLANLLLIFAFQVFYGYLFYSIGIFIAVFMAGIAAGSLIVTRAIEKIKNGLKLLIAFEFSIILFSGILALIIGRASAFILPSLLLFTELFFISGLLMGIEFPLASKIYTASGRGLGATVSALYAADLAGGWLAGLFGGIILLPALGFFNSCMAIIILKLSSLALLIVKKGLTKAEI